MTARTSIALACALLTLAPACARVAPMRPTLPSPDAPLALRVAAYRRHAAMPHLAFNGWAMRVGDGPVRELGEVRAYLAASPEAGEIMHARDNQLAAGWGFLGAGLATVLGSVIALPLTLGADRRTRFPTLPFAFMGVGVLLEIPGVFLTAAAQRRLPFAAEAYNRWLWDELALPRDAPDGTPPAATPHPSAAPWAMPP